MNTGRRCERCGLVVQAKSKKTKDWPKQCAQCRAHKNALNRAWRARTQGSKPRPKANVARRRAGQARWQIDHYWQRRDAGQCARCGDSTPDSLCPGCAQDHSQATQKHKKKCKQPQNKSSKPSRPQRSSKT